MTPTSAVLALQDGTVFNGVSVGAVGNATGEVEVQSPDEFFI